MAVILGKMGPQSRLKDWLDLFNRNVPDKYACEGALFPRGDYIAGIDPIHVSVFAPSRSGKGVSIIGPQLITCTDNMVIYDQKSEFAPLFAAHRAAMGHEVVILEPDRELHNEIPFESATFNVMDYVSSLDDCQAVADELVPKEEGEKFPHFTEMARMFIGGMLAVTMEGGRKEHKNLQMVQELLTDPKKKAKAISIMKKEGGLLGRIANQLSFSQGEELGSTLTTIARRMHFLNSPAMMENVRTSSFDMKKLRDGNMDIFICPGRLHTQIRIPWVRMVLGTALREVMKGGLQERKRTRFILDEMSSIGHMRVIDDALDKGAGYGMRCEFFFQSMGLVKRPFPDQEQTLLSNCTQIFFACNDVETAQYVSRRIGKSTILLESGGRTWGWSHQTNDRDGMASRTTSGGGSSNWNQVGRELLYESEVLALPKDVAITFMPGKPPIKTKLIKWFESPWLYKGNDKSLRAFCLSLFYLLVVLCGCLLITQIACEMRALDRVQNITKSFLKGVRR